MISSARGDVAAHVRAWTPASTAYAVAEARPAVGAPAEIAAALQAGMPPRENPRINTSVDSVHASDPLGRAHGVIHGNSNYRQTGSSRPGRGVLAAPAAAAPGRTRIGVPGLRAHRELLGVLRAHGPVLKPVVSSFG